jgi:hypothetical protein
MGGGHLCRGSLSPGGHCDEGECRGLSYGGGGPGRPSRVGGSVGAAEGRGIEHCLIIHLSAGVLMSSLGRFPFWRVSSWMHVGPGTWLR